MELLERNAMLELALKKENDGAACEILIFARSCVRLTFLDLIRRLRRSEPRLYLFGLV
jgi:hypothetical protein